MGDFFFMYIMLLRSRQWLGDARLAHETISQYHGTLSYSAAVNECRFPAAGERREEWKAAAGDHGMHHEFEFIEQVQVYQLHNETAAAD
jgi:hypothetical protein